MAGDTGPASVARRTANGHVLAADEHGAVLAADAVDLETRLAALATVGDRLQRDDVR